MRVPASLCVACILYGIRGTFPFSAFFSSSLEFDGTLIANHGAACRVAGPPLVFTQPSASLKRGGREVVLFLYQFTKLTGAPQRDRRAG